jgi:hypothetical protein
MKGELLTAPASGKVHYHLAIPGGYLLHIMNVVECVVALKTIYETSGGEIDFTREELIFSAIHHDLGKLGDEEGPLYIEETSDWHRRNQLQTYKYNQDIQYMTISDRTFYLLQKYGITITKKEMLGIRLANGLYDKSTEPYLENGGIFSMRTNIGHILHWADHMATNIERDVARKEYLK